MVSNSRFELAQEISEIGLVVHDLVDGNSDFIDEYLLIYAELFPQYLRYMPIMRQRSEKIADQSIDEKWHQWLLVIHGKPVGIIGFLYNKKRNVGLLMDFAILPEWRKIQYGEYQGLAHLGLSLSMQQLVKDAQANGYSTPLCMAAEVEYESLVQKYFKYGFIEFPIDYYEPPYTLELVEASGEKDDLDKIAFGRMRVGAFQIPGHAFESNDSNIIKAVLFALLVDHYCLPVDHWLSQKMFSEIPA